MTGHPPLVERSPSRACGKRWLSRQLAALSMALTSCSAVLARDHDQCRTSEDCQHLGTNAVCAAGGLCESVAEVPPSEWTGLPSCRTDSDCGNTDRGICTVNGCLDVIGIGCSFVARPDTQQRIRIAVLLPDSETEAARVSAVVEAATTRWNASQAVEPRLPPLLVVACAADSTGRRVRISEGFPVIVAPTRAPRLESLLEGVWGRSVLFAPFAEFPSLPELAPQTTTPVVSCRPSRASSALATLSALARVRATLDDSGRVPLDAGTVVAISQEEIHFGYREIIESPIAIPNTTITYDSAVGGADLVSRLQQSSLQPGLLVGISSDADWSSNLRAVEASSNWSDERPPFYFTVGRSAELLRAILDKSRLGTRTDRVAVLDYHSEPRNREVRVQLSQMLGADATPEQAYVLDCFYLAAYSALAAQLRYAPSFRRLSAQDVFVAVNALAGGKALALGPDRVLEARESLEATLGRAGTLDLIGASGDLDFEQLPPPDALPTSGGYLAPTPSLSELFCADSETDDYCETGLLVSPDGQLEGANRCSCFGQP
jgi:hypothetical protein